MATAQEVAAPEAEVEPEGLYEVVGGKVVEKPPAGAYEAEIVWILAKLTDRFAEANGLGRAMMEVLFRIDAERKISRRPNVAFISHRSWAIGGRAPRTAAWDVVPDLAVEVLSPGNRTVEDAAKVDDYFRAGVRAVWVIYPTLGKVYVYESPTRINVLTRGASLDGGEVLPGFAVALAELFGDENA
jgi:Uma2 family endonuclease